MSAGPASTTIWEEPGGGVQVTVEPAETIIVRKGRPSTAEVVVDDRGRVRPKRFRPNTIGVRYSNKGEGWTFDITIGGPSVRADGRDGYDFHYSTYYPGGERPPFWAAAFAVAHHPDPEVRGGEDDDGGQA